MSELLAPIQAPFRRRPAYRRAQRLWHASCISLVAGCFYPAPAWEPMNRAPIIDTPLDHHTVLPLVVDRPNFPVWVVARDEDGDDLAFYWFTNDPFPNFTTTASLDSFTSVLTIDASADLDGEEIRCIVSDGNFEDDIEIVWQVEVP